MIKSFKNKKGVGNIVVSGGVAFFLVIILLIIVGAIVYQIQYSEGEQILSGFSVSPIYSPIPDGSTIGEISLSVNNSNNSSFPEATIKISTYYKAKNYDGSQTSYLPPHSEIVTSLPYSTTDYKVDTSEVYSQLGNNAKICESTVLEYEVFLGFILGNPRLSSEHCGTFTGSVKN